MFIPDHDPIHLSGLDVILCESASGAPAAISPFNPDDERVLREDEEFGLYLN